jgi:Ca2+-binding EF-hand superfamily protein
MELEDFQRVMDAIAASTGARAAEGEGDRVRSRRNGFVEQLFRALDTDGSGTVDRRELVAGVAPFCAGGRAERHSAAFHRFDEDGDGWITPSEMRRCLTALYSTALALSARHRARALGASPADLAEATTRAAFAAVDRNNDGRLSTSEFARWLESSAEAAAAESAAVGAGGAVALLSAAIRRERLTPAQLADRLLDATGTVPGEDVHLGPADLATALAAALPSLQAGTEVEDVARGVFGIFDAIATTHIFPKSFISANGFTFQSAH